MVGPLSSRCLVLTLVLVVQGACSSNQGCDGTVVETEGQTPSETYWTEPFQGEDVARTDDAQLPFVPVQPDLEGLPTHITWTDAGIDSSGRISKLPLAPGTNEGPRIAWTYESPDGPFFVQQALVAYGRPKLEQEAEECEVSDSRQRNPGFSMTQIEDGSRALLIAQSNVMSVVWVDEANIVDEAAVEGYDNVMLETQLRAPGDRFDVDQLLEIANDLRD